MDHNRGKTGHILNRDPQDKDSEMAHTGEITRLLAACRNGDRDAVERLFPLVYDELRRIARSQFRSESPGHTLQPTALVHEAYLKLVGGDGAEWQSRAHFFAFASQVMRHVLVDHARSRKRRKRGGGVVKVSLDPSLDAIGEADVDMVALDDALQDLARLSERQAKVVELRYFGGLTIEEIAETLAVTPSVVRKEWTLARAWLRGELDRTET